MKKRLYVIEGTPCSGKSTTGRYVAELTGAAYVDEGSGDHPADYEFHAYLKPEELDGFSEEEREQIVEKGERKAGGIVCPLAAFEGVLFDKLLQHKIYDFLPWEVERPVMLAKWKEFAEKMLKEENDTYVLNCVLLQNPMCETMFRFDFSEQESEAYIREICQALEGIEIIVIYLKSSEIEQNVRRALPERGEEWLNAVTDYHVNSAYGRRNQLEGFDGYIRALKDRQERELRILERLPVRAIVIENPSLNWEKTYELIKKGTA